MPKFLLGVGCQKGGTTWLHHFVASSQNADMGLMKEYHIWDVVYKPTQFQRFKAAGFIDNSESKLRWLMQNVEGFYEKYFQNLVSKEKFITGDITPSYACLDQSHFENIKKRIKKSGFDIRVIFIMRDPVQRCWSATKMQYCKIDKNSQLSATELFAKFTSSYKTDAFKMRTSYDRTVSTLRQVFKKEELFFGVFENFHTTENLKKLAKFLDIDENSTLATEKINTTSAIELPDLLVRECRQFYDGVYSYCYQNFPVTRQLWIPLKKCR